jgi:hypothetical protein
VQALGRIGMLSRYIRSPDSPFGVSLYGCIQTKDFVLQISNRIYAVVRTCIYTLGGAMLPGEIPGEGSFRYLLKQHPLNPLGAE